VALEITVSGSDGETAHAAHAPNAIAIASQRVCIVTTSARLCVANPAPRAILGRRSTSVSPTIAPAMARPMILAREGETTTFALDDIDGDDVSLRSERIIASMEE
jgi:hypothetical protein